NVEIDWKLPLRPADEIYSDMMGFSVAGRRIVEPKHLSELDNLSSRDYPYAALQRGEQGEVAVRLRISETGTVTDATIIDSSSSARRDEGALSIIKEHFHYEPGTVDGMPAAMSYNMTMKFLLGQPRGARDPIFCHSRPIIGQSMSMVSSGAGDVFRI